MFCRKEATHEKPFSHLVLSEIKEIQTIHKITQFLNKKPDKDGYLESVLCRPTDNILDIKQRYHRSCMKNLYRPKYSDASAKPPDFFAYILGYVQKMMKLIVSFFMI